MMEKSVFLENWIYIHKIRFFQDQHGCNKVSYRLMEKSPYEKNIRLYDHTSAVVEVNEEWVEAARKYPGGFFIPYSFDDKRFISVKSNEGRLMKMHMMANGGCQ